MTTITNRAFLNAIINGELVINSKNEADETIQITKSIFNEDGTLIDEMKDFAAESIVKLDKRKDSRKGKLTPSQRANEQLKADIATNIDSTKTYTAKDIAADFGITPAKASAMARQLVAAGVLSESQVKGDKGKVKGYTLIEGATYTVASED